MRFFYQSQLPQGAPRLSSGEVPERALELIRELDLPHAWEEDYQAGDLLSGHIWSLTLGEWSWSGRDCYPPGFRRMLWALGVEPPLPCSSPLEAALLDYGLGVPPGLEAIHVREILALVARQPERHSGSPRVARILGWLLERHPDVPLEDGLLSPWLNLPVGVPLLALAARRASLLPQVRAALQQSEYPAARALAMVQDPEVLDYAVTHPVALVLLREHWPEALPELANRCLRQLERGLPAAEAAEALQTLAGCQIAPEVVRRAIRQALEHEPELLGAGVRALAEVGPEPCDAGLLMTALAQGRALSTAARLLEACLEARELVDVWLGLLDQPELTGLLRERLRERSDMQELVAARWRGRPLVGPALAVAEGFVHLLLPELEQTLASDSWEERARAARAARGVEDSRIQERLRHLVSSDPADLVRCEAAASLAHNRAAAWWCAGQLGPLLASPDRPVRRRAAEVLVKFRALAGPARPWLERAYASTGDERFKTNLRASLEALGSSSVQDWAVYYRDSALQIRVQEKLLEVLDPDHTVLLARRPDPARWEQFWEGVDFGWTSGTTYAGPLEERLLVAQRGGRKAVVLTCNVGPDGFSEAVERLFRLAGL